MDLIAMLQAAPHSLSVFQNLDDSTVSVLAMLLGICAGWFITGLHQQMKAKRIKVSRKQNPTFRKE